MIGQASTSARTLVTVGATGASMSPRLMALTSLTLKAAVMQAVASLVARLVIVGSQDRWCSVWRLRAIGLISETRTAAGFFQGVLGRPKPMHWVSSRVRLVTLGMQPCFM